MRISKLCDKGLQHVSTNPHSAIHNPQFSYAPSATLAGFQNGS